MRIGLSFVSLASAAVLALSAGAAQARVGVGEGQTAARAQAAKAIALWYQDQARHQTIHRSLRPDDRAGVHGVAP